MKRVETTLNVLPDRSAVIHVPEDVAPDEHRVVVVFDREESGQEKDELWLPKYGCGPWPEGFTVSRDQIYGDER